MKRNTTASVVCFGEVLWDIFPEGMKPGGAPLNVAYHLNHLGVNSNIISKVGSDEWGNDLLQLMEDWEISPALCQQGDQHPTGRVLTNMDDAYEMSYDIVFPVAWDYIQWEQRYQDAVAQADALVFGSLIMRNTVSCETLLKLLPAATYRVFDVNLRPPHYIPDQVLDVLKETELLKLNQGELDMISSWTRPKLREEADKVHLIQDTCGIREILVTKGEQGAAYYNGSERYESLAYRVEVADTVGSGDAFLAAFLAERLAMNSAVDQQLATATALGAFVASKNGACPDYSLADLEAFKRQKGAL